MSKKHKYTNYAAMQKPQEETPVAEPEVAVEEVSVVEEPVVEETVILAEETIEPVEETVAFVPKKLTGTVVNCDRLNIRQGAKLTKPIIGVLMKGDKVTIEAGGNEDFYEISTSDTVGYCMKQFIEITN